MSNGLTVLRQASFGGGPRRLRRVVAFAREMGCAGLASWDALDEIEGAIWAEGLLPYEKASQRRAWNLCLPAAKSAFYDGARSATFRFARDAVTKHGGNAYKSLYATAWAASTFAYSDEDIVDAVSAALAEGGHPPLPDASPMYPIRRARLAAADGDDSEMRSFGPDPAAMEARQAAVCNAERHACEILDVLGEGATVADFSHGLQARFPEIDASAADEIAARCVKRNLATPVPAMKPGLNPFETLPDLELDALKTERHRRAIAMWSTSARSSPTLETAQSRFDLDNEPGLLGDIARWSQTSAFRPVREFAQPAALATLSALFGRRWATPTGLGLNLYIVAVAETGGGKDALIGAPRALLAGAGFRHLLGPGDFSSDAAIEKSLRTRPVQLMPLDEFGKLAQAMMGRNAPSFAKLAAKALLEIYPRSAPGSEWTGKARASDEHDCAAEPLYSPTLSLLGVSTPEGFFEGMSQENLNDGFLNRLTVVRAGKAGERQRDPSRLTPPPALVDALRAAYEGSMPEGNLVGAALRDAGSVPTIKFAKWADDAALAAIERVEAWEDDAADNGRRGVTGRTAEQVQKIATLRALSRNPADPAVEGADITWAFEMVKASVAEIERGARENMSGSEFEALVNAIERAVIQADDAGIAWSHLVRVKGVSKADDRLVEAAVKRLESAERIWRTGAAGKRLKVRRPDERRDDDRD